MRAPKVGTETYYRPFHVGYINPRLNKGPTQEELEEAVYNEFIGQLMPTPEDMEDLDGSWHIRAPLGFIHFPEEEDSGEEAQADTEYRQA